MNKLPSASSYVLRQKAREFIRLAVDVPYLCNASALLVNETEKIIYAFLPFKRQAFIDTLINSKFKRLPFVMIHSQVTSVFTHKDIKGYIVVQYYRNKANAGKARIEFHSDIYQGELHEKAKALQQPSMPHPTDGLKTKFKRRF